MKLLDLGIGKSIDRGVSRTVETLLRAGKLNRVADLVAMSAPLAAFALAKLRETLGDPLLIPTAAGVELTARAKKLAAPLRDLLERITEILPRPELFDPAFCESIFTVAASDYVHFVLGPRLAAAFAERAPRAELALIGLDSTAVARPLQRREIDIAIGTGLRKGANIRVERLLTERYRCIARKGHPRIAKQLSARAYAAEAHVLVMGREASAVKLDPALADPGRKRRAVVTVPHFLLVREIVAQSDLIATLPERVARADNGRLQVFPPPMKLGGFTVVLAWNAATDNEPEHLWLRGLVGECAAAA